MPQLGNFCIRLSQALRVIFPPDRVNHAKFILVSDELMVVSASSPELRSAAHG